MTSHLDNFLEIRGRTAPQSVDSIRLVAEAFTTKAGYLKSYSFREPFTSILVGQVQSGKTGHYLGIAAAVADVEPRFPIFVLLTQSLVGLQQQTYAEAKKLLTTFDVFDESDEMSFRHSLQFNKPKMVVLKKTKAPLRKWAQILDRNLLSGRPLFIIDDEADATGLNTMINANDQSEINRLIELMVVQNNSFFLQVTATPHAIFLQTPGSVFRPKSHLYFAPGPDYLGGAFFYPRDADERGRAPYVYKATSDSELAELQNPSLPGIPKGLQEALFTFILTAAYRLGVERDQQCNFLLHPSARTADHNLIRDKVKRFILDTLNSLEAPEMKTWFKPSYQDLKASKPQLPTLDALLAEAQRTAFNVVVMNSSQGNLSRNLPSSGANVFIGGNVLSRGIVVPRLQTIYYCRTAQRISLDTYWQHSRAFGYDRDETMVRLFMPPRLYSNFVQMSESVARLFEMLASQELDEVKVVTPKGIHPTRNAVVKNLAEDCIVGGAHHFPVNPSQVNAAELDGGLAGFDEMHPCYVVDAERASSLLWECGSHELGGVPASVFVEAMKHINREGKAILIVRRDRAISANTGTLLSPDDRRLANRFKEDAVLVLYRLTGETSKGWDGQPFWIPDVKLPDDKVVYFK
jgi:hypothetical protein